MNKKIIGIFVCMFLIGVSISTVSSANIDDKKSLILIENKENLNLQYDFITRERIIEIAEAYANYEWYPTIDNALHGNCPICGERVDTVDRDYYTSWPDYWGWKAGELNIGVPYKTDGYSSISGFNLTNPEDFYEQYTGTGNYEGEIHYGGDIYVQKDWPCSRACGIDCSGFVSRCWNLPEKHYTTDFPEYGLKGLPNCSSPIKYNELKPGDLINCERYHAILFKEFVDGDTIICIDSGGVAMQVAEFTAEVTYISEDGFNIRLEGHYNDYTEPFGNQLFETRQYDYISGYPSAPTIDGPINGNIDTLYEYSFTSVDPDEDQVYYYIDWGDGTNTGWLGPFDSGHELIQSHIWEVKNHYLIKAKAKDINDLESGWSIFEISMPRNKEINRPILKFLEQYPNLFPILQRILRLIQL